MNHKISTFILFFLIQTLQLLAQNEDNLALIKDLYNEKLLSKETYELIEKFPTSIPRDNENLRLIKKLGDFFNKTYEDRNLFYPGIWEKSNTYWTKSNGVSPNQILETDVPPKPDDLKKYESQIKKLVEIFAAHDLISQNVKVKLYRLIELHQIQHPYYLIQAIAVANIEEDLSSIATLTGIMNKYFYMITAPHTALGIQDSINAGKLDIAGVISCLGVYRELNFDNPNSNTSVLGTVKNILNYPDVVEIKQDSFIEKRQVFYDEDEGDTTTYSQLFLQYKTSEATFQIEYPIDDNAPNPYHAMQNFVTSKDFIMLANQMMADGGLTGRGLIVNTFEMLNHLLDNNGFEPFREEFASLRCIKKDIVGFFWLNKQLYEIIYYNSFKSEKGLTLPFHYPMDGFDSYIPTSKKVVMFDKLKNSGFFKDKTEKNQEDSKFEFLRTTFSDPVDFLIKMEVCYSPLYDCFGVINDAYGEGGNPHGVIFRNLQRISRNEFNPTDLTTIRENGQAVKIGFKLNGITHEYPLKSVGDFINTKNSPCREIMIIAAQVAEKIPNAKGKFYRPSGYMVTSSNPGQIFYLSEDEVKLFQEVFGLKMIPY